MRTRWSGRRRSWGLPPSALPIAIRWRAWCARTRRPRSTASACWSARGSSPPTASRRPAIRPTATAYGRLCRLLTSGNRRAVKGQCHFAFEEIIAASEGQILIVLPPRQITPSFAERLGTLAAAARGRVHLGAVFAYDGNERRRLGELNELASRRAPRSSPPTTRSITTPAASRSPMCSPASARNARLRKPATASRPTPSGI